MTDKLPFLPEQSGYTVNHGDQLVQVKLDGGAPRTRADFDNATSQVQAGWLLDLDDYQIFMHFMKRTVENGSLPFLVELILDFSARVTYRATMVAGSLKTNQVRGLSRRISMNLEVEQPDAYFGSMVFSGGGGAGSIGKNILGDPPDFTAFLSPGDDIQIVGAKITTPVAVSLDGIFEVATIPTDDALTLVDPDPINPNWALVTTTSNVVPAPAVIKVPT